MSLYLFCKSKDSQVPKPVVRRFGLSPPHIYAAPPEGGLRDYLASGINHYEASTKEGNRLITARFTKQKHGSSECANHTAYSTSKPGHSSPASEDSCPNPPKPEQQLGNSTLSARKQKQN